MLFVHQTGARIGEAMGLEPKDVDLRNGTAIAYDTKNGEDRLIYLTPEIIEDLRTLPPRNGRVFGYVEPRSVYRTLRKVCEEAGLEYLATHQVGRHSFATALEEAGFSAKAVADAGGWKSVALVQKTYMHPKDAGKRAAEAMASRKPIGTNLTHAESGAPEAE